MAVVAFAGAEHGGPTGITQMEGESLTGAGFASVVSTPVRSGSYAFRVNPTATTDTGSVLLNNNNADGSQTGATGLSLATYYCEFGFRYATKSTAATGEEFCEFRISGGTKGQLRLNSAGTVSFYDKDAALVATGTTVLAADTWYHIGFKGTTSGSASAYELRINDVVELSGTALQNSTNFFGPRVGKNNNRNSTVVDYFFDDLIISDDAFLGSLYTVGLLRPEQQGSAMTWTSGTGASDYGQVFEIPASTANYVKCTAGGTALFKPLRADVAVIAAVKPVVLVAEDIAVTSSLVLRLISGGTTVDTTARNIVSTTGEPLAKIFVTNPATSAAWHYSEVNELEFGVHEANAVAMRLHWTALSVVWKVTRPGLNIPPLEVIAQETGLGEGDNQYVTDAAFLLGDAPPLVNQTWRNNAFAADLGFAWDMEHPTTPTYGVLFGDTFGSRWRGPFVDGSDAGEGDSIITAFSNSDIATMVGAGTITVASGAEFADPVTDGFPYYYAAVNGSGTLLYFKYTDIVGNQLQGITYLGQSLAGPTTIQNGWSVLAEQDWRGSTFGRSTTQDLTSGYVLDTMAPLDAAGRALEVIPSAHDADDTTPSTSFRTFTDSTSLAVASLAVVSGVMTVTLSADHNVTKRGQSFLIAGVTGADTDLNNDYVVRRVGSPRILQAWLIGHADVASPTGTITCRVQSNSKVADPLSAADVSRIPTGACAVPGAGAGGVTRQYALYCQITHWNQDGYPITPYNGFTYSDDEGDTWTQAAGSGTIAAGSNGVAVSTFVGAQTLQATGTSEFPTSGTVELDTSTGVAHVSYTGKTGSDLTGCTLIQGTGTLATGGGIRYAMWGNNLTYTANMQFAWPYRHTDGYVYAINTGGVYRHSECHIARCAEASLLDLSAWRYWDGTTWNVLRTSSKPIFGDNMNNVFTTGNLMSEPSLMYHTGVAKWVSTYVNPATNETVLRFAPAPQGPWTRSQRLMYWPDYFSTEAYGGMLDPRSGLAPNGSGSLYFILSLFAPYVTILMRASLSATAAVETETIAALGGAHRATATTSVETETVAALTAAHRVAATAVVETETVTALSAQIVLAATPVVETETVTALSAAVVVTYTPVVETETVSALLSSHTSPLTPIVETETVAALSAARLIVVLAAIETETVSLLTAAHRATATPVVETETVGSLVQGDVPAIGMVTTVELDCSATTVALG